MSITRLRPWSINSSAPGHAKIIAPCAPGCPPWAGQGQRVTGGDTCAAWPHNQGIGGSSPPLTATTREHLRNTGPAAGHVRTPTRTPVPSWRCSTMGLRKFGSFDVTAPISPLHGVLTRSLRVLNCVSWPLGENNPEYRRASCCFSLPLLGTHGSVFSIKHLFSSNGPLCSFQWSPRFHDTVYLAGSQS